MRKLSVRHQRVLALRSRRAVHCAQMRNLRRRGLSAPGEHPYSAIDPGSITSLGSITQVRYTLDNRETDAIGHCMTPPSVFCLDTNLAETLTFLQDFREVRLLKLDIAKPSGRRTGNWRKTHWIGTYTDIAAIDKITPAAALVLAAEFDRAIRRNRLGRRGIVNASDWNPSVARTLIDIGFLEHLSSRLPDYQLLSPNAPEVKMLAMLTGSQNEPQEIVKLNEGLQSLMDAAIESALSQAIYYGLIEAMDNCAAHAYPPDHTFRYPTERGRWWMSGSITNGRELEVIFFDQGATIPGTLPRSGMRETAHVWVQRALNLVGIEGADDGQRIQAAMEAGRSAYRQDGRGHGLVQMRDLVDRAASGSLRILSRRGHYIYEKDVGETFRTLDRSIGGTLVHWRFWL